MRMTENEMPVVRKRKWGIGAGHVPWGKVVYFGEGLQALSESMDEKTERSCGGEST